VKLPVHCDDAFLTRAFADNDLRSLQIYSFTHRPIKSHINFFQAKMWSMERDVPLNEYLLMSVHFADCNYAASQQKIGIT
jgi:hypothetical protein